MHPNQQSIDNARKPVRSHAQNVQRLAGATLQRLLA